MDFANNAVCAETAILYMIFAVRKVANAELMLKNTAKTNNHQIMVMSVRKAEIIWILQIKLL